MSAIEILHCGAFAEERKLSLDRIAGVVRAAGSFYSRQVAWHPSSDSEEAKFSLLMGGPHPRVIGTKEQEKVLRTLLISLGGWMEKHEKHEKLLKEILTE